ncbi:MAG: serine hydrolase domain-containing protein [Gemmatimonadota bacterium]
MKPSPVPRPTRSRLPGIASLAAALGLAGLLLAPVSAQAQTPLRQGQTVAGTLSRGDTARYTVEVGEDFYVLGQVDQVSVDVVVRVLNSEGRQIGRFDGPGRGPSRFAGTPDDPGTYTIQLIRDDDEDERATWAPKDGWTAASGAESGEYRLTLLRVERLSSDPKKRVDQYMARYDGAGQPGGAVQVWRDGRTLFSKAYGMANLAYDVPFRTDTRTNIGSTTKQFTAFAIMLQAERGRLSLDDDIRKHVPELPEFDHTITVRHIITHTSGLREFLNLLVLGGRRLDRGDWIDRSELIEIVQRQPALQNVPGAEWNYNNTAYGLAALIVERTSGQSFPEFMQENVFGPLGMTRTMVRPSVHHIVPDMSEGYAPGPDGWLQLGDLGGAVGAGGIYTTVGDLQKWVQNYANPRVGSRKIFDEMMTSFVLNDGKETGYGYGLFIDEQRGLKRIHHGGADVSHRSMLAYYPEINAGITVQGNGADFQSGIAFELAEAFFGDAMEPEEKKGIVADDDVDAFDPADYDAAAFDELAGRYALDARPSFVLTFTRDGETFYTQATGQSRLEIRPTSASTFQLTAVEASVTFLRSDDGAVTGVNLDQGGQTQHATRLEDEAPAKWEPDAKALQAFTGRYFSEELEAFYTIGVEEGAEGPALVVHHRRLDDTTLTPAEQDQFSGDGVSFAFERDRNGVVIGFYVANGRTRDVRFERVR